MGHARKMRSKTASIRPRTRKRCEQTTTYTKYCQSTTSKWPKLGPDAVLQGLLQRRRAAHDRSKRANLSTLIRKHFRHNMRRRKRARVSQTLAGFKALGRLDSARGAPFRREKMASLGPKFDTFCYCLGNIFVCDIGHVAVTLANLDDSHSLVLVPSFTLHEFGAVLRDLHAGKAAGTDGIKLCLLCYTADCGWRWMNRNHKIRAGPAPILA